MAQVTEAGCRVRDLGRHRRIHAGHGGFLGGNGCAGDGGGAEFGHEVTMASDELFTNDLLPCGPGEAQPEGLVVPSRPLGNVVAGSVGGVGTSRSAQVCQVAGDRGPGTGTPGTQSDCQGRDGHSIGDPARHAGPPCLDAFRRSQPEWIVLIAQCLWCRDQDNKCGVITTLAGANHTDQGGCDGVRGLMRGKCGGDFGKRDDIREAVGTKEY